NRAARASPRWLQKRARSHAPCPSRLLRAAPRSDGLPRDLGKTRPRCRPGERGRIVSPPTKLRPRYGATQLRAFVLQRLGAQLQRRIGRFCDELLEGDLIEAARMNIALGLLLEEASQVQVTLVQWIAEAIAEGDES